MFNPRQLRRILRHLVPEGIKKRVRHRLFGFRPLDGGVSDWGIRVCEPNIELRAGGISATFPKTSQASLAYHCFENRDSIDELRGFLAHAKSSPGMLIDVGAADGLFSALYCLANPKNRAFAFEPSSEMFEHLVATVELNKLTDRLTAVNAAAGACDGNAMGSLSSCGMLVIDSATSTSFELRILSLDSHFAELEKPTTIKIDVEGYESEVLRGAQRLIAVHKPVLFLEFHLDLLEQRNIRAIDLLKTLCNLGYQFETSLGRRLTARKIATSPKAIIRFVARVKAASR